MSNAAAATYRGEARAPGGSPAPAEVTLGPENLSVAIGGAAPWEAAYRDLSNVAIDGQAVVVQFGEGSGAETWRFERFGAGLTGLVRGLRDGRLRQWLTDGLVDLGDDPVEVVEVAIGTTTGLAQVLHHRRGVAVAPLDERLPRFRVRRADIGSLEAQLEVGRLCVNGIDGRLATIDGASASDPQAAGSAGAETTPIDAIELRNLGQAATRHAAAWTALRDGAAADLGAIVGTLLPDVPFGVRRGAASAFREGHPVDPASLGEAWPFLERAVLGEPTFAASYAALVARAGGEGAPRWLAMAPESPGAPESPKLWFLVGLPGNLLALELVSAGAHATYLFRVAPRAGYAEGSPPDPAELGGAVREVSEALIDGRFLREPIALPAARLAEPRHLRYRLAIEALPSLAVARSRFVARVVHRDPASWEAALDDLIRWHATVPDDTTEWPGRAAQEAAVDEAAAE